MEPPPGPPRPHPAKPGEGFHPARPPASPWAWRELAERPTAAGSPGLEGLERRLNGLPGALELGEFQGAIGRGEPGAFLAPDQLTGIAVARPKGPHAADLQRLAFQLQFGARPGPEGADLAVQIRRGAPPVQAAHVLAELGGVGGLPEGLLHRLPAAAEQQG